MRRHDSRHLRGFTLIELLVVLAIVATLLTIVAPRYVQSVERANEAALKMNLRVVRDALDKHYADHGAYPESLQALVERRYVRDVPVDPLTGRSDSWILLGHPNGLAGVYDVRSGAAGNAADGVPYAAW